MKPATPVFDSIDPRTCINAKIRRINRMMAGIYTRRYRATGFTPPQVSLLFVIGKRPGITGVQLSQQLVLEKSSLSRELKPLIANGLIVSVPGKDKRTFHLTLTDAGYQAAEQVAPLWEQQHGMVHALIGDGTVQELDRMLRLLAEHAQTLRS